MKHFKWSIFGVIGLIILSLVMFKSHVFVGNSHPRDELRVDIGADPATLDPVLIDDSSSSRVANDLFAGLVAFNQKTQVVPDLAKNWQVSDNGLIYTFNLRHNLKFSDGSPLIASDVVYSYRRLADPQTGSPYMWILSNVVNAGGIANGKLAPDSLGVYAPDNNTVVIKLVNPDNNFLYML
jgi:oligopeptide transport system substrate-binding protein